MCAAFASPAAAQISFKPQPIQQHTGPAAVVGDVMRGRGGRVVAAFQMSSDLGAIIGPPLAGQLVSSLAYPWAWSVTACVLLAGVVMAIRMPETLAVDEPATPAPASETPDA